MLFGKTASVLTVHTSLPINSVPELIAYAKANPGKLAFATSGNATGQHFATESLRLGAGIDIIHVPYKGVAPAYTDVLSGRVPVMFMTYGSGKQHWESGKVRPLAVSTPKRFSLMPELPTMAEASGIKDFSLIEWFALVAPADDAARGDGKLHKALSTILSRPEHAAFNHKYGLEYEPLSIDETQAFMMNELDRMTRHRQAGRTSSSTSAVRDEQLVLAGQLVDQVDEDAQSRPELADLVADRDVVPGHRRGHLEALDAALFQQALHDAHGEDADGRTLHDRRRGRVDAVARAHAARLDARFREPLRDGRVKAGGRRRHDQLIGLEIGRRQRAPRHGESAAREPAELVAAERHARDVGGDRRLGDDGDVERLVVEPRADHAGVAHEHRRADEPDSAARAA